MTVRQYKSNTRTEQDIKINKAIGKKINASLSTKIFIDSHECQIGASIGISIYPQDGKDITSLLKKADDAMYKVKSSGKNSISFAD